MNVQKFEGEHDENGVYVYQAYCNEIADFAIKHQTLGGDKFDTKRMTWIKPSFAWVLYRSGYGTKHNQERILKIKLSHKSLANILELCSCKEGGGGSFGRVQWDPARDLYLSECKEPRKILGKRAIQIGIKGHISELYVKSIMSIEDVTDLAHQVGIAHGVLTDDSGKIVKNKKIIKEVKFNNCLLNRLPKETIYLPHCNKETLEKLGMMEGKTAEYVGGIGKGKNHKFIKN